MNGKRAKRLKQEFALATGSEPGKMVIVEDDGKGTVQYIPSAWRRLKKSYKEHRRGN
jgi:hypothetical protein